MVRGGFLRNNGVPAAEFFLDVTAIAGTTELLDVSIEHTVDGQDYVLGAFTQVAATANETIAIAACPEDFFIRVNFTNTITDADFTVSGERY